MSSDSDPETNSGSPYKAGHTETGTWKANASGKNENSSQSEIQPDAGIKTQSGKSWQDTSKSDIDSASRQQAGTSDEVLHRAEKSNQ